MKLKDFFMISDLWIKRFKLALIFQNVKHFSGCNEQEKQFIVVYVALQLKFRQEDIRYIHKQTGRDHEKSRI